MQIIMFALAIIINLVLMMQSNIILIVAGKFYEGTINQCVPTFTKYPMVKCLREVLCLEAKTSLKLSHLHRREDLDLKI